MRTKEEIDALVSRGIAMRRGYQEPEPKTGLDKYYQEAGRLVWLDLESKPFTNGDFSND